jgi:branched-subunit amino acid transport protein
MSSTWATVLVLGVTTALIRAAGPVIFGGRPLARPLRALIPLLAPALLAALVATETFGNIDGLELDERAAGVGAAALVLSWRRDALLVAIAVAAVVTALLRAAV